MLSYLLLAGGLTLIGGAILVRAASVADIEQQRERITRLETMSGSAQTSATRVAESSAATKSGTPASDARTAQTPERLVRRDDRRAAEFPSASVASGPEREEHAAGETSVTPTPPHRDMPLPTHITIPAVAIDTAIVEIEPRIIQEGDQYLLDWPVADWAAGHHRTSVSPGEDGNIVIAGHADVRGEVFRGLHDIELGDEITIMTSAGTFRYIVAEVHLRLFNDVPIDEQLAIGLFIAPMPEERLTLVTCWPYGVDDHRLFVVAKPVD